jgi:hypothetical protein
MMPIQLNQEDGGKILIVHVSGKLTRTDYEQLVPEFERLVRQHGKLRLLFDMTGFQGWEAGALWQDIKFDVKHHADIERLAMIGDKKWEHGMATFCKPFTKATIRYFDHAESTEARKWLCESSSSCSESAITDKVGALREVKSLQESDPLQQTAQRLTTF